MLRNALFISDQTPARWTQLPSWQAKTCQQVNINHCICAFCWLHTMRLPYKHLLCSLLLFHFVLNSPYCDDALGDKMALERLQKVLKDSWLLFDKNDYVLSVVTARHSKRLIWSVLKTVVMETASRETVITMPPTEATPLVRPGTACSTVWVWLAYIVTKLRWSSKVPI